MNQDIELYLKHPIVKKYYDTYNVVWKKHPDFPYLTYFGINFDCERIVSVKFYFHFFQELTDEEVSLFLPTTQDFNFYKSHFEISKLKSEEYTGCAMEVKFQGSLQPVFGFHFRLKPINESFELIGYPKNLPHELIDLTQRPGINFEYSEKQILMKKYFYFNNDDSKKYFAERFNYKFLKSAKLLEYSESEFFSKLNVWFGKDYQGTEHLLYSDAQQSLINQLCQKYKVQNNAFGYYENSDVKAAYFFSTLGNSNALSLICG